MSQLDVSPGCWDHAQQKAEKQEGEHQICHNLWLVADLPKHCPAVGQFFGYPNIREHTKGEMEANCSWMGVSEEEKYHQNSKDLVWK